MSRVIVLAGASGFIGSRLIEATLSSGYEVRQLVRSPRRSATAGVTYYAWDPAAGTIDESALAGAYGVVCLNGAGLLSRPWTAAYKRTLWDSRLSSVATLVGAMRSHRPEVFLSGSAVGYYGPDRGDEILTEGSTSGSGFLARLCEAWEEGALTAERLGVRTLRLRTGLVMGGEGGMLGILQHPYRMGLGAKLGDGSAWMSTIARDDYVRALLFLLAHDEVSGPVNMVGPNPVRNAFWHRALARHFRRPAFLTVPTPVARLAGEMASEAVLASQRAYPRALLDHGFTFLAPDVEEVFAHELPLG